MNDNVKLTCPIVAAPAAALAIVFMILCTHALAAQGNPPKYEVDPSWPRPLPNKWVTGAVSGVCTDAQDHVFIVNRGNLTENELDSGRQAPPVIEFDPQGNVANSWGNRETLPEGLHGCFVDYQGNVWIAGSDDTFIQKYSHDGSKVLLQIGQKGVADSSDGTIQGIALNSSHTGFYRPSAITVDPSNGDVYVADGEEPGSNHRVAVFDRNEQARAMSSCRYRTVWRLATTGWCTYATDGATGFRSSTKWGPSKKTYLFLMRKEAKTDQDSVMCRARGERLSGWASPLIA